MRHLRDAGSELSKRGSWWTNGAIPRGIVDVRSARFSIVVILIVVYEATRNRIELVTRSSLRRKIYIKDLC